VNPGSHRGVNKIFFRDVMQCRLVIIYRRFGKKLLIKSSRIQQSNRQVVPKHRQLTTNLRYVTSQKSEDFIWKCIRWFNITAGHNWYTFCCKTITLPATANNGWFEAIFTHRNKSQVKNMLIRRKIYKSVWCKKVSQGSYYHSSWNINA